MSQFSRGRGEGGETKREGKRGGGGGLQPHFVRNVPNFLKQYESILTTNKKNYMNESIEKESRKHLSIEEALADGATLVTPNLQQNVSESEVVSTSNQEVIADKVNDNENSEEKEEMKEEIEREYFKDGKLVFNKVKISNLKRKRVVNDTEVHNVDSRQETHTSQQARKKKEKRKKTKNLTLLSFDNSEDR